MDAPKRISERSIWIGVTALLLAFIAVLAFSPRVLAGSEEAETQRQLGIFYEVFRFVQQNYVDEDKVEAKRLVDGALKGLFQALDDPHSAYLNASEMQELNDTTTGQFGGVGLIISKVDQGVEVVSPIEDTPAYRAGVHAGDIITAIGEQSLVELSTDQVVQILRGEPGTTVTVTILRGRSLKFNLQLQRAMIEVPTVKMAMIPGDIGYLRIIQFTPLTPDRVREALKYFERNRYRALVIDLRSNPGGLLSAVVDVADYFIAGGPIVSTRSRVPAENHVFYASKKETIVDPSLPIAVLINRGSASASEILAGALKDTGRAKLLGEKSYGKGSVQQVKRTDDAGFRLTMSRYYTPAGISIDKVGILPDIEVKEEELSQEEEKSLPALLEQGLTRDFVIAHPQPSEQDIQQFIQELRERNISLRERLVRRLISNEIDRTNDQPPVYDLEYDLALQEAVKTLQK